MMKDSASNVSEGGVQSAADGGEAGATRVFKQIAESSTSGVSRGSERKRRPFSPRQRRRIFDESLRNCEEAIRQMERLLPDQLDEDGNPIHLPAESARLHCAFLAKSFKPVISSIRELGCENDSAQSALANARGGLQLLLEAGDIFGLTAIDPTPTQDSLQAAPDFIFLEFTNLLWKVAWNLGSASAHVDRSVRHVASSSRGGNSTASEVKGMPTIQENAVFQAWEQLEARGVPEHERASKIAARLEIGAHAVRRHLRKENSPLQRKIGQAKGPPRNP